MVFFSFAFAGAKTPLQRKNAGLKNALNRYFLPFKRHTAAALSTLCYSSCGAFVSVVSAIRIHFLTFIDNYPICQRASSHALVSVVSVRVKYSLRRSFPLFLSVRCIWGQSYNLITNKPNNLRKKFS